MKFFKRSLFVMSVYVSIFTSQLAAQSTDSNVGLTDKFYLTPEKIHVDEKNLYVDLEGAVYSVSALHVDSKGIYIQLNDFVDQGAIAWCDRGHPNPPWRLTCMVCGRNLY